MGTSRVTPKAGVTVVTFGWSFGLLMASRRDTRQVSLNRNRRKPIMSYLWDAVLDLHLVYGNEFIESDGDYLVADLGRGVEEDTCSSGQLHICS